VMVVRGNARLAERWTDVVSVADDAGEERLSRLQLPHEIVPHLLLDRAHAYARLLAQRDASLTWGRNEPILTELAGRHRWCRLCPLQVPGGAEYTDASDASR